MVPAAILDREVVIKLLLRRRPTTDTWWKHDLIETQRNLRLNVVLIDLDSAMVSLPQSQISISTACETLIRSFKSFESITSTGTQRHCCMIGTGDLSPNDIALRRYALCPGCTWVSLDQQEAGGGNNPEMRRDWIQNLARQNQRMATALHGLAPPPVIFSGIEEKKNVQRFC